MVLTRRLSVLSEGGYYPVIITEQVREVIRESGIQEGAALVYYQHTTGSVMVVELEAGILADLQDALERLASGDAEYKHHVRGHDFNGAAHVRSAFLGVSVHVPVLQGELLLGTFQEILMLDLDPARKERVIIIQAIGE